MIDNGFTEIYFRHENVLMSNNQQIFGDRTGSIVYAPPIVGSVDLVNVESSFSGSNRVPKNVNLIVDSISLISTNPNVQKYLPLKIGFGTRQIQFSDPTLTTITDYNILIDPRLDLTSVINGRYNFDNAITTSVDDGLDEEYYIIAENNSTIYLAGNGVVAYNRCGQSATEPTFRSNGELIFQFLNIYTPPITYLPQVKMKSNGDYVVVLLTSPTGDEQYLVDISDVSVVLPANTYPNIYQIAYQSTTGLVPQRIIDFEIYRDILYTLEYNLTFNRPEIVIYSLVRYIPIANPLVKFTRLAVQHGPSVISPLSFKVYRRNTIYTCSITSGPIYVLEVQKITLMSGIDYKYVTLITEVLDSGLNNKSAKIFVGGGLELQPNIIIFISNSDTNLDGGKLYYLKYNYGTLRYDINLIRLLYPVKNYDRDLPLGSIKQYANVVYYSLDQDAVAFINLDTMSQYRFFIDKSTMLPINAIDVSLTGYGFSMFSKFSLQGQYNVTYARNERPVNQVYMLTYDYVESATLFNVSVNSFDIKISLPNNNPFTDMEIFKYVFDFRVKFTIERDRINPTRPLAYNPKPFRSFQSKRSIKSNSKQTIIDKRKWNPNNFSVQDLKDIYAR